MKPLRQIKFAIFSIAAISLAITGCKRTVNTPMALVGLHLHTYIDSAEVQPYQNLVYSADSNNRYEELTYAQFYLTNLSLHSTTKGWQTIPGSIVLKRIENEEYFVGNLPADTYDDVRFTFGLNNTLNSGSPSSYPSSTADSVLSTSEPFMYAGTGQGYAFMKLAGFVDTSAGHTQINPIAFNYTIGGMGDTVLVTLPVASFTLAPNIPGVQFVHIICDYGIMMQNVPLTNPAYSTGNSFGTATQQTAAQKALNAILNMFRYECNPPNGDC